jgi:exoribonuclease R
MTQHHTRDGKTPHRKSAHTAPHSAPKSSRPASRGPARPNPRAFTPKGPLPKEIESVISITGKGVGYIPLSPDNRDERIRVETDDLNTALHGDIVKVALLPHRAGEELFGTVT